MDVEQQKQASEVGSGLLDGKERGEEYAVRGRIREEEACKDQSGPGSDTLPASSSDDLIRFLARPEGKARC